MRKSIVVLCVVSLIGVCLLGAAINQHAFASIAASKSYGNITLTGGFQAGQFNDIWDLTAGDLTIVSVYDGNGLVDDYGGDTAHAWSELGIHEYGAANFNPNNRGIWLATDYEWTANTFDPDPAGKPIQDLDDKFILQKVSGHGEADYNLPSSPPAPGNNHRVWFDRDGVDQWQAQSPLAVDGGTYNTNGKYLISLKLHATSNNTATAYLSINNLDQGFETNGNWNNMELSPAGMTWAGDMKHLQLFYGIYGYGPDGVTHVSKFENISVNGYIRYDPVTARVINSAGTGISGISVEYYDSGNWLPFGNTDGTGLCSRDLLPDTARKLRVTYNGKTVELTQNTMVNPDFVFQTKKIAFWHKPAEGETGQLSSFKLYVKSNGAGQYMEFGWVSGKKYLELFSGSYDIKYEWTPIASKPIKRFEFTKDIANLNEIYVQNVKFSLTNVQVKKNNNNVVMSCNPIVFKDKADADLPANWTNLRYNTQQMLPRPVIFKVTLLGITKTFEVDPYTTPLPVILNW